MIRSSRRPNRGRVVAACVLALALALVGGCSAILGDATYECTDGQDACPADMICNTDTHQCELSTSCSASDPCPEGDTCNTAGRCVSNLPDATTDGHPGDDDDDDAADASSDARTGAETGPGGEGGSDAAGDGPPVDSGPQPITCATSATCPTGTFCATADQLGNGFVQQCTRSCCTSSECASGFICVPVGTTGQYCLPDTNLSGQPPLTCCGNASCNGKDCFFGSGGEQGTSAFGCSNAGGTGVQEDDCADNGDCKSGYCGATYEPTVVEGVPEQTTACRERCCNSTQCGGTDAGYYCHDESSLAAMGGTSDSKDYVSVCVLKYETKAFELLRNNGTSCAADNLCKSGVCDSNNLTGGVAVCVDTCCIDSDCANGQVCRPRTLDPPFLRCQNP
jgi:hypothetical protein